MTEEQRSQAGGAKQAVVLWVVYYCVWFTLSSLESDLAQATLGWTPHPPLRLHVSALAFASVLSVTRYPWPRWTSFKGV